MTITVRIQREDFDIAAEVARLSGESRDVGAIVTFSGIDGLRISDTICDRNHPEGLPPLEVDEPTISMTFQVNKSPF
ncbi:MAG TPA: hypothetical protein PLJ34_04835, partial [Hyphomicrobiales bacterium]|nr:hypothetical protein [Hyphomicrobiales bacterium]